MPGIRIHGSASDNSLSPWNGKVKQTPLMHHVSRRIRVVCSLHGSWRRLGVNGFSRGNIPASMQRDEIFEVKGVEAGDSSPKTARPWCIFGLAVGNREKRHAGWQEAEVALSAPRTNIRTCPLQLVCPNNRRSKT